MQDYGESCCTAIYINIFRLHQKQCTKIGKLAQRYDSVVKNSKYYWSPMLKHYQQGSKKRERLVEWKGGDEEAVKLGNEVRRRSGKKVVIRRGE